MNKIFFIVISFGDFYCCIYNTYLLLAILMISYAFFIKILINVPNTACKGLYD